MKKLVVMSFIVLTGIVLISFQSVEFNFEDDLSMDSIRKVYAKHPSEWPKANVDKGINFNELDVLPSSPIDIKNDSVKSVVELGKILFFDPRLSSSNLISCSSCHAPDLNWTDGKQFSEGHDNLKSTRNSPSLENVWFFKRLFWDGRVDNFKDQVAGPITAHNEMNQDMKVLPKKLSKIKGYKSYFKAAFGTDQVTEDRILESLATFQQTIASGKTAFDRYLESDKEALTDQQLKGLHLFRTKARCMNCHHGALFTDNEFHNLGLTYYKSKYEDLGLYNFTKKPEDVGKFKTPGLRNVMRTGPWFHNGLLSDMEEIMDLYNMGMPFTRPTKEDEKDPLFPKNDPLLRGLRLSNAEKTAIISFLEALSSDPTIIRVDKLPK